MEHAEKNTHLLFELLWLEEKFEGEMNMEISYDLYQEILRIRLGLKPDSLDEASTIRAH